jgi:hypothetical protein
MLHVVRIMEIFFLFEYYFPRPLLTRTIFIPFPKNPYEAPWCTQFFFWRRIYNPSVSALEKFNCTLKKGGNVNAL